MAMLTKTGLNKILRRIYETGGLSESMEQDIERIRADFDEREGELRRYGEVYDGEDRDEYDYVRRDDRGNDTDSIYTPREEEKDWRKEYETMRDRYLKRFFGGQDDKVDEIMEETKEDVKRDGEDQTFDELLERVEG